MIEQNSSKFYLQSIEKDSLDLEGLLYRFYGGRTVPNSYQAQAARTFITVNGQERVDTGKGKRGRQKSNICSNDSYVQIILLQFIVWLGFSRPVGIKARFQGVVCPCVILR